MNRRITSYIYNYNKNEKQANCGYFRFDITEAGCKLSVKVKVPEEYNAKSAGVYLIKAENERLKGVLIGKSCSSDGNICYRHLCTENDIAQGIGISEVKGVLIYDDNIPEMLLSGGLYNEKIDISIMDIDNQEENTVYTIDVNCHEKLCNEITDGEEIEEVQEQEGVVSTMEIREENLRWQEVLFAKFPKVRVDFGGDDSEAIKMRPHDLVWFPRRYWRMSNNSYLLSGYNSYQYIMLVRGSGNRKGSYYLAIPGKNAINEALQAKRQGFGEFVTNSGDFGFWCCKVGQ